MSQSRARATRKTSLREQLARKRAKVITLYFPDGDAGEKAVKALDEAEQVLTTSRRINSMQGDKSTIDIPSLEKAVIDAERERDKHCMALSVRGLSEDERDALASEYTGEDLPDKVDADEKKRIFEANVAKNKEWTYAALATVAQDSDLTVAEWREELTSARWTAGDIEKIRVGILEAYGARPADGIPKG